MTNQIANGQVDIAHLDKLIDENEVKEEKIKENIGSYEKKIEEITDMIG